MSLAMQIGMIKGFYSLGDGSVYEAFIKGHQYSKNSVGFSGAGGCMAACYVEANMMGDPLAKLKSIESSATIGSAINGFFATTGILNGGTSVNGVSGVVNLNVNTAGNAITLGGGSQFKATGKVTVNGGGTFKWNAPGGVGRNGIAFTTRGRLVCEGSASRYFGARFSGLDEILVTGYNTTFDFDKTGATRDVSALRFIGSDSDGIGKCNYIRSREGGIFSPSMSIPVQNGTLVLQTTNIGGSGNASNTTTPMFTLTNAVLKIVENPHWGNEMLNRPIWMNGATIFVAYQSFGFGAKVSGSNGTTLRVLDKTTNTISGNYDAEINGPFRVEVAQNAVLKINVPLTKSSYTGSLVKTGDGRLELRAANTFTGGIAINEGTVVFGKEALTSSACGTVTVESGATLKIETLPLASVTKLTVRAGGKLILPGDASTASYQLVDPSVGSLDFANGALVYNEHNLTTPLKGSATSDGYYMDTSSFLHWQDQDGTWSADSTGSKWMKGGTEEVGYANGNSVQFPDHGKTAHDIAVSGTVQPGYITFNNAETVYNFTGSGSKISIENLYTVGDTTFEPEVSAGSKAVVTSGKTTFKNLTTASVSVAPKGKMQLTGTLTPATYIKQIVLKVTGVRGYTLPFVSGAIYSGFQINGLRFYANGELLTLPVGTTVSASGTFNKATTTANLTVKGSSGGAVTSYEGSAALKNVFDNSASEGWGCTDPGSTIIQSAPSFSITITLGAPMKMFTKYSVAGGNADSRSSSKWSISVVESSSGGSYTVDSRTSNTSANKWSDFDGIQYKGASSASVNVSNGGTLFLNGTYNAPITVGADSTLAVTNGAKLTATKGFTLSGNVTLDVNEAKKDGWFEVLHGANLAANAISKFALNSDEAAAKIEGGNLYVATQGVKKGPYTREVSGGNWNWDSSDWKGNGTDFGCTWSQAITRMADDVIITMNNSSTGTLGCAVNCNAIIFTNETDNVQAVLVNGGGVVSCKTLDFSGLKGEITWTPSIAGASVYAGSNTVHLLNGAGATLNVASNGYVSTAGTFATYENDVDSVVRFAGTGARSLTTSQIPSKGTVSFSNMTLSGGFQNTALTYLVEAGDSLTLSGAAGNNARMTSTFDIRGGAVTVNPQGSWWYGENGPTKFNLTGGTLTCNATGTTIGNSGSGVVFGYQGEGTFPIEINVSGGSFIIPNSIANIWNPTAFNLSSNGLFHAKGIGSRNAIAGNVNINEQSVFEIGSVGMAAGALTYNLYGGTIAGYEDGAKIDAPIALGGAGTLAAAGGTVLYVNGAIKADGATLGFGSAGYTGAVRLAVLPEGVTNFAVNAGTLDLGSLRPTNAILTKLDGTVAAELTDDELRTAATGGLKLIRTSLTAAEVKGRVAVVTSAGTAVPATGSVKDGALLLVVDYVYPLYAEVKVKGESEQSWVDLDWRDAIGMPFNGDWTNVTEAVLSNALDGVEVAVSPDFTRKLTVVNAGALALTGTGALATLDDSASTGRTTAGLVADNVIAGLDTVVTIAGSGTLTVAADHRASIGTNIVWNTAKMSLATGARLKYLGPRSLSAPIVTTAGVRIAYDGATVPVGNGVFATLASEDGDDWTVEDASGFVAPVWISGGVLTVQNTAAPARVYYGGVNNAKDNSRIDVTGGTLRILANGKGTDTNGYGLLLGMTAAQTYEPQINVSGGTLEILESSVNFWENSSLTVSGTGLVKVKGLFKGNANNQRTGTINLNGGELSVGSLGITENGDDTLVLNLNGGTLSAWDDCEVKSAVGVTASGTTRFSAADGTTLTVAAPIAGAGMILCEPQGTGKVVLKGGDCSGLTLGGTFEIWLTAAQEAATKNVDLFTPAAGYATNVTVRSSTGGEPDGVVCEYGGKITFVPSAAYRMPIVGEVYTNNTPWHLANWHDSSAAPKAFDAKNLPNYTDVILNVHSNASILCDLAQTLPALTICGEGAATFVKGSALTIASARIETDVATTNDAVTITTADIAEGATLTPPAGSKLGNVTGGGTVACHGFCPTYANLTDANTWMGTAKYVIANASVTDLPLSRMGNASSAVELAGTMVGGYFEKKDATIGTLRVTGSITMNNGYSDRTYTFGRLVGSGTLRHSNANQHFTIHILDAGEFTGTLSAAGAKVGIGVSPTYENGVVNVASGAAFGVASRTDAASSSTVTVAAGGWLNLVQGAADELVYKVTSGTLNLNGGVRVNGGTLGSDEYAKNGGTITLKGGTRVWNGGAEGVWNTTSNCWRDASGADVAWHDGFAGGNVAHFANVAAVTLGGPVAPVLVDLAVPTLRAHQGYVPTAATVLFENVNLADVAAVAGDMYGAWISSKGAATPCFVTRTAGQIGVQFQKRDNELKCVKVVLTQDGANVKAQAVWAAYVSDAEPGTTNFESASHNGTVVTADDGEGYGIKNLTLTMAGHGELTVRAAQNFVAPVAVTNGTLRLTAGEMTQDLTLTAGARLDLVAEPHAVTNVVTSGKLTGATLVNVTVNGMALSAEEWTLDGNRLIRDTSASAKSGTFFLIW